MKRLVTVIIFAILPVGVALIGLGDTDISVADTSILDNNVTSSIGSGDYHSRVC